jgi:putative chitinase
MFETEPGPFIYIVKTGDTLDSIARRFGMSDTAIAEMSRIHIQNLIRPGHRLLIPGPEAQLKPERGAPPDLGPTADLPARKRGPSPIPLPQPGLEAPPVPDRDSGSEPELETPSGQHTYVAQAGDTLMTIARRFNVTVKAIIEASEIEDPNLLQPGQRLTIPGVYR